MKALHQQSNSILRREPNSAVRMRRGKSKPLSRKEIGREPSTTPNPKPHNRNPATSKMDRKQRNVTGQ